MLSQFMHTCRHFWTQLWHTLFVNPVRGNLMHEAWDQHGEPLPRLHPTDVAHRSSFCNGVHARGV